MRIEHLPKKLTKMLLMLGLASSSYSHAATLTIDSFTHNQTVTDWGDNAGATTNTVTGLTGTSLANATRTFIAQATDGDSTLNETIRSSGNLLRISNGVNSAGTASVLWNFDPVDFTQYGNAILLDVTAIDLGVKVEMIANGSASSGVKNFSGTGNFLVNFAGFSNSSAFNNVSSFSLNFTGPAAWDGKFRILTTFATPVPVPPAFALMGSALFGLMGFARRKSALISNS